MKINIDFIYPIGSIYMTTNNINPDTLFGGTWERYSEGRCLVGYDSEDNDFKTIGATGGEKAHTLIIPEIPSHNHTYNGAPMGSTGNWGDPYRKLVYINNSENPYPYQAGIDLKGGDQPHNNLQPYIVVYIWRRIK